MKYIKSLLDKNFLEYPFLRHKRTVRFPDIEDGLNPGFQRRILQR
ncbi:MAG: hypothetical protein Ct9H90mP8_0900 [Pseudomonadota bacterium]|nr:MAG: hypothetical protein Ct9H90mP8_0900 [Pseudomonadota bacterium]